GRDLPAERGGLSGVLTEVVVGGGPLRGEAAKQAFEDVDLLLERLGAVSAAPARWLADGPARIRARGLDETAVDGIARIGPKTPAPNQRLRRAITAVADDLTLPSITGTDPTRTRGGHWAWRELKEGAVEQITAQVA